jgi:hypothetical protein
MIFLISASKEAGIIGMSHHAWPPFLEPFDVNTVSRENKGKVQQKCYQ